MMRPTLVLPKRIILDFDDVVVDCAGLLNKQMNLVGNQSPISSYVTYNFPFYHGLDQKDLKQIIDEKDVFTHVEVFDGAVDAIHRLIVGGYEIHIVTSRGAFDDAYNKTKSYLEKHGISFTTLSIVDSRFEKKSDHYKHLISGSSEIYIIDDRIDNLLDAQEYDVFGICINQPWNVDGIDTHGFWHFPTLAKVVDELIPR